MEFVFKPRGFGRVGRDRGGERLGDGWVRIARSGAAKQGALLREGDPVRPAMAAEAAK